MEVHDSGDLQDALAMAHYLHLIAVEKEPIGMRRSHLEAMCVIVRERAYKRLPYAPVLDLLLQQAAEAAGGGVADDLERLHQMIEQRTHKLYHLPLWIILAFVDKSADVNCTDVPPLWAAVHIGSDASFVHALLWARPEIRDRYPEWADQDSDVRNRQLTALQYALRPNTMDSFFVLLNSEACAWERMHFLDRAYFRSESEERYQQMLDTWSNWQGHILKTYPQHLPVAHGFMARSIADRLQFWKAKWEQQHNPSVFWDLIALLDELKQILLERPKQLHTWKPVLQQLKPLLLMGGALAALVTRAEASIDYGLDMQLVLTVLCTLTDIDFDVNASSIPPPLWAAVWCDPWQALLVHAVVDARPELRDRPHRLSHAHVAHSVHRAGYPDCSPDDLTALQHAHLHGYTQCFDYLMQSKACEHAVGRFLERSSHLNVSEDDYQRMLALWVLRRDAEVSEYPWHRALSTRRGRENLDPLLHHLFFNRRHQRLRRETAARHSTRKRLLEEEEEEHHHMQQQEEMNSDSDAGDARL
jgi:hypothetical protein